MTRRPGEPDGPEDGEGPGGPDEPSGIIRSLLALLQEMEERGERTRSGHARPSRNTSVDFSVSVGGLGDVSGGAPFGAGEDRAGQRTDSPDESTSDPHVTTRETADGMVVAADLPGVVEADVETRLDPEAEVLVIVVEGRDAARLPLQSEGWTVVDSRFSNGVLEVELARE